MEKTFENTMKIMVTFAIASMLGIFLTIAFDKHNSHRNMAADAPTEILAKPASN